eukprot:1179669-Prorocentrum_minimum.AAC.2
MYSYMYSFIRSFVPSFIHSFIHSFVPSFLHSFVASFLHSLVRLFLGCAVGARAGCVLAGVGAQTGAGPAGPGQQPPDGHRRHGAMLPGPRRQALRGEWRGPRGACRGNCTRKLPCPHGRVIRVSLMGSWGSWGTPQPEKDPEGLQLGGLLEASPVGVPQRAPRAHGTRAPRERHVSATRAPHERHASTTRAPDCGRDCCLHVGHPDLAVAEGAELLSDDHIRPRPATFDHIRPHSITSDHIRSHPTAFVHIQRARLLPRRWRTLAEGGAGLPGVAAT